MKRTKSRGKMQPRALQIKMHLSHLRLPKSVLSIRCLPVLTPWIHRQVLPRPNTDILPNVSTLPASLWSENWTPSSGGSENDLFNFAVKVKTNVLEGRSLQMPRRLALRGIGIQGMAAALHRQIEECVDTGDFTVVMCAGEPTGRSLTRCVSSLRAY